MCPFVLCTRCGPRVPCVVPCVPCVICLTLSQPGTDPQAEISRLNALIAAVEVDVAFVGIGENGHLAFNDPPADFDTDQVTLSVHDVVHSAHSTSEKVAKVHSAIIKHRESALQIKGCQITHFTQCTRARILIQYTVKCCTSTEVCTTALFGCIRRTVDRLRKHERMCTK